MRENDEIALITIATDVLFDFDKSDIRVDGENALQQIVAVLQNRYHSQPFSIHGHTDSKGSAHYNMALSKQRARAVLDWFTRHGVAIEGSRLEAHGETKPLAPNKSADGTDNPVGRQQNRRGEIIVQRDNVGSLSH